MNERNLVDVIEGGLLYLIAALCFGYVAFIASTAYHRSQPAPIPAPVHSTTTPAVDVEPKSPTVAPVSGPAPVTREVPGQIVGTDITISNVLNAVNAERYKVGLPILKANPLLQAAAEAKLADMLERGYFAHNTPEGEVPWVWLRELGYPYDVAGENLARRYFTVQQTVDAWMASPTHRANILKATYTETGIAIDTKESVVVQFFAVPLSI